MASGQKLDGKDYGYVSLPENTGGSQRGLVTHDLTAYKVKNNYDGGKDESDYKSKIVLFIVGGLTYPEIRVCKQLGIFFVIKTTRVE